MKVIITYDPEGVYDDEICKVSDIVRSYQECNENAEFLSDWDEKKAMKFIADAWGLEYSEVPELSIFS